MHRALIRTAYSPIVYETKDFAIGVYDHKVRLIAQDIGIPLFLGALGPCIQEYVDQYGANALAPGDVIVVTDPYFTGAHPPDVVVFSPVFWKDQLVAYAITKAHFQDLGAAYPYCTNTTDMYQEGLILPPVKLYERGKLNQTVIDIMKANSRLPEATEGDLNAEVSACLTGERRLLQLIDKFGLDTFRESLERIHDHGEKVARLRIADIPDGTWEAEDFMDSNGVDDEPVKLKVAVTIDGTNITVDFTGSAPEQRGPINCLFPTTVSAVRLTMKSLTTPDLPASEGSFRPLKVIAPKGSVFHATRPSPVFVYGWPAIQAEELLMKALAPAIPDRVGAQSAGDICAGIYWGRDPKTGRFWSDGWQSPIGQGASSAADGENALMHFNSGDSHTAPVEMVETRTPLLVRRLELRTDSGGPGKFRGGCGVIHEFSSSADAAATLVVEKTKSDPWGLFGGKSGMRTSVVVGFDTSTPRTVRKCTNLPIIANSSFAWLTGGGGGFGSPLDRNPQSVLGDYLDGYISLEQARLSYGIVIDPAERCVNELGTDQLRAALRKTVPSDL